MEKVKKIALITSASNFERQKNVVNAVSKELKNLGGCILYVFTCYGIFPGNEAASYNRGEASIYELLEIGEFDGCIMEGNIGSLKIMQEIGAVLQKRNIPFVVLHFEIENMISYVMDSYCAARELMKHLIVEHKCTKINMIAGDDEDISTLQAIDAYRDALQEYGISWDENRMVRKVVSVGNGKEAFHIFRERGVEDADAIICNHDVYAIGLCLELEAHGYRVPEDIRLCSLNRSTNSMAFRPELTGVDKNDDLLSQMACQGLMELIEGKEISEKNYFPGKIYHGQSCGCPMIQTEDINKRYQDLVLAKVEAGNQISSMMQYNDALEEVQSLEELGQNVKKMLEGINCRQFLFCLNSRTKKYIENELSREKYIEESAFDKEMITIIGQTAKQGELKNHTFSLEKLLPIEPQEGDVLLFYPIHNQELVYGYLVFINEFLPVNIYNYRICHESIGSSMENLRRQMILKKSIEQLSKLHMQDALTRLHNRFAWERFAEKYVESGNYAVVMLDMDGLKGINDCFGHLAGNHAIMITANAIKESVDDEDLLIRYGGDEFQILSHNLDLSYWENTCIMINKKLEAEVIHQKLPYELGISSGYCISSKENPLTLEECCEQADKAMYENKKMRKAKKITENN